MKIQVRKTIFPWEFLQKKEKPRKRFLLYISDFEAGLDFNGEAVVGNGKAVGFCDLSQLVVNVQTVVGKMGVI